MFLDGMIAVRSPKQERTTTTKRDKENGEGTTKNMDQIDGWETIDTTRNGSRWARRDGDEQEERKRNAADEM